MFFDKKTFNNHFSANNRKNDLNENGHKNYARIVTDPSGVRWGYLAYENVYECINTGRRMNSLLFENHILEQTESALANAGDYSTETGHGVDNVDRLLLVRKGEGNKIRGQSFCRATAQSSGLLYRVRELVSAAGDNSGQPLLTGCVFENTTLVPTVGSFSFRHDPGLSPPQGLNIHSSSDSAEGTTMSASGGLANNLYTYFGVGSTWSNLNRGGTGCELTVIVGGSCDAGLSAGDVLVYRWPAGAATSLLSNTRVFYAASGINQITRNGVVQGSGGATWPSQALSAGGTAYWGVTMDFNVSIGTPGGTMKKLLGGSVERDLSKE